MPIAPFYLHSPPLLSPIFDLSLHHWPLRGSRLSRSRLGREAVATGMTGSGDERQGYGMEWLPLRWQAKRALEQHHRACYSVEVTAGQ